MNGRASLKAFSQQTAGQPPQCRRKLSFRTSVQYSSAKTRLQGQRCLSLHSPAQTARLTRQEPLKKQAQKRKFLLLKTFALMILTKQLKRWLRLSEKAKSLCFPADFQAVMSLRARANSLQQHSETRKSRKQSKSSLIAETALCSVSATASRRLSSSVLCPTAR